MSRTSLTAGALALLALVGCAEDADDEFFYPPPDPTLADAKEEHRRVAVYIDVADTTRELGTLGVDLDRDPRRSIDDRLSGALLLAQDGLQWSAQRFVDIEVDAGRIGLEMGLRGGQGNDANVAMRFFDVGDPWAGWQPLPCLTGGGMGIVSDDEGTVELCLSDREVMGLMIEPRPMPAPLYGRTVGERFSTVVPGTLPIRLSLGAGRAPLDVKLHGVQVVAAHWGWGFEAMVSGAFRVDDLRYSIAPRLAALVVARYPAVRGTSAGNASRAFLDGHPRVASPGCPAGVYDDELTVSEVVCSPLVQALLAPDIDLDGDGVKDGVSLGFKLSLVTPRVH